MEGKEWGTGWKIMEGKEWRTGWKIMEGKEWMENNEETGGKRIHHQYKLDRHAFHWYQLWLLTSPFFLIRFLGRLVYQRLLRKSATVVPGTTIIKMLPGTCQMCL